MNNPTPGVAMVSVIVVAYQSAGHVDGFLDAVSAAIPGAEVVVVDNASGDVVEDQLSKPLLSTQLVSLDRNCGFGRAANIGAEVAEGKWLLFANPDVRVRSVDLPGLIGSEPFGLGGAMITEPDRRARFAARAEATYLEDWIGEIFGRFLPKSLSRHVPPGRVCTPDWVAGALFVTRREEFLGIGGFDRRFFLYFEDRDLGNRFRRAGLGVRPRPVVAGDHAPGSSSKAPGAWREGWGLISWLEYVGIWRGQARANEAAAQVVSTLTGVARMAERRAVPARVSRKAYEARDLVRFARTFDDLLPRGEADTFYPHARIAIDGLRRRRRRA